MSDTPKYFIIVIKNQVSYFMYFKDKMTHFFFSKRGYSAEAKVLIIYKIIKLLNCDFSTE